MKRGTEHLKYDRQSIRDLPLYAADFQEAELDLLPAQLREYEQIEAVASVNYLQKRSLLIVTQDRIMVLYAESGSGPVLDLPIDEVLRCTPSAWYGAGNVTCITKTQTHYFSLMSIMIYAPLAKRISELAKAKRKDI